MAIKTRAQLYAYFEQYDIPIEGEFRDLIDSMWSKTEMIPVNRLTYGEVELVSGAAIDWDYEVHGANTRLLLAHSATINLLNWPVGQWGQIAIKQDAVGAHTVVIPNMKVGYNKAGEITLSAFAGAIDTLHFFRSGFGYLLLYNNNYT